MLDGRGTGVHAVPADLGGLLEQVAARLCAEPDPHGWSASGLGLSAEEFTRHLGGAALPGCGNLVPVGVPGVPAPGDTGGGRVLFLDHPAESPRDAWDRLRARLAAGADEVLWLAGRGAPAWAQTVVETLLDAGLGAGGVHLLHDPSGDARRAALACGGWDCVDAALPPAEGNELHAWLERSRASGRPAPALHLRSLLPLRLDLHPRAEPCAAAEQAARLALGRAETLSGRWAGQVGRIRVPAADLSAFTAALLGRLEEPGWEPRAGASDPHLRRRVLARRGRELAQGATLLLDGRPHASLRPGQADILGGLLFTNAEPQQRLDVPEGPLPVLLLERVEGTAPHAQDSLERG